MTNYGLIDLGSNSIRLVVYEVKDGRAAKGRTPEFRSLINDKVMAGLAAYVADGVFTQAGIDKAASVLRSHARHAQYFKCRKLEVFATAVLRNATNSKAAVAAIEKASGLSITLLSERDEAHLGFAGTCCDAPITRGTLVDIGGGSTELTRVKGGRDSDHVSLPQGSLSSFAGEVRGVIPTPQEARAISERLRARLAELPSLEPYRAEVLYGIGGSARAAAKMYAQMNGLPARPKTLTSDQIGEIIQACHDRPDDFAHTALKASAERVHTLVPGCIILQTLFEELGASRLEIGKRGVREGYLVERMLR